LTAFGLTIALCAAIRYYALKQLHLDDLSLLLMQFCFLIDYFYCKILSYCVFLFSALEILALNIRTNFIGRRSTFKTAVLEEENNTFRQMEFPCAMVKSADKFLSPE
jgi:hypothetical protein